MLSERQRRFVDEYIAEPHATKAAIRAGYSERGAAVQAQKLLAQPDVVHALADWRRTQQRGAMVKHEWVRAKLLDTMETALTLDPPDLKTVVKCLELLGRDAGMWPARPVEITASINVSVQQALTSLSGLSVAELRALAQQKAPTLALPERSES